MGKGVDDSGTGTAYTVDGLIINYNRNGNNSLYQCYWADDSTVVEDVDSTPWRLTKPSIEIIPKYDDDFLTTGIYYPVSKPILSNDEWRVVVNGTIMIEHDSVEWNREEQRYIKTGKTEWREHLVNPRIFPYSGHPDTTKGSTNYSDKATYHAIRSELWIKSGGIDAGINYCEFAGIEPPVVNKKATLETDLNSPESAIKRMCSADWWERKLTIKRRRKAESKQLISRSVDVYCSDACFNNWLLRQKKGKEYMESLEAISEHGEVIKMVDLLKGSHSNPRIRRIELGVRNYGFAQYAESESDVFGFYTITAPSKYHPNSKKYNGWSPRQTHADYLMPMWEQIRAELKRQGIQQYGFRLVEPHGDGCPHWHMALFFENEEMRAKATEIMKEYALAEDIGELKVKDYDSELLALIDGAKNDLLSFGQFFDSLLHHRKRIFKRDLVKLAAIANALVSDVEVLKSKIPASYRHFLSELSKIQSELSPIAVESLTVSDAIDGLAATIRIEYLRGDKGLRGRVSKVGKLASIFTNMINQFDRWATVKSKGKKGKGKKIKEKWRVRFDYDYVIDTGAIIAYIMKYIGKNIDGREAGDKKIEGDYEVQGLESEDSALRVRAWASLWGIRQFQQVGGSSVTAWRVLRTKDAFDNELLEEFRVEADSGNWEQYLSLQGGALMPMRQQLLRPYYDTFDDAWTGDIKTSSYGEHVKKLLGVKIEDADKFNCVEVTKDTQWKLERIAGAVRVDVVGGADPVIKQDFNILGAKGFGATKPTSQLIHDIDRESSVNSNIFIDSVVNADQGDVVDSHRERSDPWLSVNNYTGVEISKGENVDLLLPPLNQMPNYETVPDWYSEEPEKDDICLEDLLL